MVQVDGFYSNRDVIYTNLDNFRNQAKSHDSLTFDLCKFCSDRPSVLAAHVVCTLDFIIMFCCAIIILSIVFRWKSNKMRRKFRFAFALMTRQIIELYKNFAFVIWPDTRNAHLPILSFTTVKFGTFLHGQYHFISLLLCDMSCVLRKPVFRMARGLNFGFTNRWIILPM